MHDRLYFWFVFILAVLGVSPAFATQYLFTVTCQTGSPAYVQEWDTGTGDPGKEYLRLAIEEKALNCAVGDYNPKRDKNLLREKHGGHEELVVGANSQVILENILLLSFSLGPYPLDLLAGAHHGAQ
jgi:hypothetical protein